MKQEGNHYNYYYSCKKVFYSFYLVNSSTIINFRTCLHLSCLVGSEECVRMLLEYGANPNMWDSATDKKATPLHCAASAKSLACVKVNRI